MTGNSTGDGGHGSGCSQGKEVDGASSQIVLLVTVVAGLLRGVDGEPERYREDVPNAEVCVLDAGHFALNTKADEIADMVRQFTSSSVATHTE